LDSLINEFNQLISSGCHNKQQIDTDLSWLDPASLRSPALDLTALLAKG